MEFEVKIIDKKGVVVASTYIDADDADELAEQLTEVIESSVSGESDWLDGAFDA